MSAAASPRASMLARANADQRCVGATSRARRERHAIEPDPRERSDWFQRMPEPAREEIRRDWLADAERNAELDRRERLRTAREVAAMALVFVAGDLLCPGTRVSTPFVALAIGAALGWACCALDAARLLTGSAGLAAFIAFQWTSRGGLSGAHLFLFFIFGVACAYLGYRREERGID